MHLHCIAVLAANTLSSNSQINTKLPPLDLDRPSVNKFHWHTMPYWLINKSKHRSQVTSNLTLEDTPKCLSSIWHGQPDYTPLLHLVLIITHRDSHIHMAILHTTHAYITHHDNNNASTSALTTFTNSTTPNPPLKSSISLTPTPTHAPTISRSNRATTSAGSSYRASR